MYKDVSTGRFLDKSAKLILRELHKSSLFGLSFKGLGVYKFKLADLASQLGYDQSRTTNLILPLDLFKGGSLRVVVTTAFMRNTSININNDEDDNMSVMSDVSDVSTSPIGASFESAGPTHQGNFLQKLGFQETAAPPRNYEQEEDGEVQDDVNNMPDYFDEECQAGLLDEIKKEIGVNITFEKENNHTAEESIAASQEMNNQNIAHYKLAKSKQKRIQASKEAFELYQIELANRSNKIELLEAELAKQTALNNAQVLELKTQVNILEASLQRERASKTIMNSSDASAVDVINSLKSEIGDISSKYGRVAAELQIMNEDLKYYKLLSEKASAEKKEELQAAQEAATAAVMANMRRAEVEQENADVLNELIEIKMKYANLAIDYESETKKNFAATKRLQDYAQKIASQEVKYLQALAMALPSNAVDTDGKLDAHISNKDNSAVVNVSDIYVDADEKEDQTPTSQNPSRGASFSMPNGPPSRSPSFSLSLAESSGPSVNPLMGRRASLKPVSAVSTD
eukprot:CAMPEP_0170069268 /NCGR_PEP_ID=MMETSP0019_2-20121128/8001_1 /TAXON_ID=98059 /ORGANISM="Dinobryon sp., Strain UTEXLB2267" /LENGTH=514 /DNA_ID=CAMNT_0010277259 /DNA_START=227 /DNA_END=1771 /DNA_ORIENTATION=+